MSYHIGIDAGSKTVKVVVCDDDGRIVASLYSRHRSSIKETLIDTLNTLSFAYGNYQGTLAVTGSAGMGLADALRVPFVQEVVATTLAVSSLYPTTDATIELGGEDAKIMYLGENPEHRMNATCAGGTGGFLDTIAFMLGVSTKEMGKLALGSMHPHSIASRCAVFAQTDVRPLLNAGVPIADIAGSALDAVVAQTLGGLACGRPIRGNVLFLGGPLEHIPALVMRFRSALHLSKSTGIKPPNAHLVTALGAALHGAQLTTPHNTSLMELAEKLEGCPDSLGDLPRLEPLFNNINDLANFKKRHDSSRMPRATLALAHGPLYVGMDAGSTAIKLAALDAHGRLVYSDCKPSQSGVLDTASQMLIRFRQRIPQTAYIAQSYVTGYGEKLLKAALKFDKGIVETVAHAKAARLFVPNASFALDIGGQDMKALWLDERGISNAILNETCSSGCGSFISGCAHSLRVPVWEFSELALRAQNPVDLGCKCTVFMTSRVRHAQKVGALKGDIAAGICYSIVKNALQKVIGLANLQMLSEPIVVQGGAFKSNAVVRAFELLTNKKVIRPDVCDIMGAIGCALIAKEAPPSHDCQPDVEAEEQSPHSRCPAHDATSTCGSRREQQDTATVSPASKPLRSRRIEPAHSLLAASKQRVSTLLSAGEIKRLKPQTTSTICPFCSNSCSLSVIDFGNGERFISGGRCSRSYNLSHAQISFIKTSATPRKTACNVNLAAPHNHTPRIDSKRSRTAAPNVAALQIGLLKRFSSHIAKSDRAKITIGILPALLTFESLPFWHTLFKGLGFSLAVPPLDEGDEGSLDIAAWESIPSESVCFPAKLLHFKSAAVVKQHVNSLFAPTFVRGKKCAVAADYARVMCQNNPLSSQEGFTYISPALSHSKPERFAACDSDRATLLHAINDALGNQGYATISESELQTCIQKSLSAYRNYRSTLKKGNALALQWAGKPHHRGVVLACRPYHVDPAILHGIDRVLQDLGFAVILGSELSLDKDSADVALLWNRSASLERLASFVASDPSLDLVCLHSFGCGYDAVNLQNVELKLAQSGKAFTALKVGDISDLEHIRIRLRTLAETPSLRTSDTKPCAETHSQRTPCTCNTRPSEPNMPSRRDRSSTIQSTIHIASLTEEDVTHGRMCATGEVCFIASSLAGSIISAYCANPESTSFCFPNVCTTCVCDAIPNLVENSGYPAPSITWKGVWGENRFRGSHPDEVTEPDRTVGLVGCPLLVFEEACNEGVRDFIHHLGWKVQNPNPHLMAVEDTRFLRQLQLYYESGIRDVLYLQSFGCLKGHVYARGSLQELKRLFPGMRISVLDFSPETSKLNRESRILLFLSAKHTL